jgi:hypothetical protein
MMGVINEDNSFNIKKIINVVGIVDAIRYLGGYEKFKEQGGLDILTKDDKIDVIKDNTNNRNARGITISRNNGIDEVLYAIYDWGINVETYTKNSFIGERDILYDDLSDEMIDNVFSGVMKYQTRY